MALARERSSPQGFDPSSSPLDFFGGCSDGHITSLFDLQESQSVVDFKAATDQWGGAYPSSSSSVLSFEQGGRPPDTKYSSQLDQEEECAAWINMMEHEYRSDHHRGSRLTRDTNCFEMTDGYGCTDGQQEDRFGLLYPSSSSGTADCLQEEGGQMARSSQKRPFMGGDMQAAKKLCGNDRKAKAKPSPPAKDPQSLAAKNRRERISDRLKVLQELVPNGTKVDLVTMLEKAISYVKFLQLQVKVLATDEFWPEQGGKAPEVTQVKEAIDAILSSHRGRNSNHN